MAPDKSVEKVPSKPVPMPPSATNLPLVNAGYPTPAARRDRRPMPVPHVQFESVGNTEGGSMNPEPPSTSVTESIIPPVAVIDPTRPPARGSAVKKARDVSWQP
eukprot:345504-Rhodomonas_salina.1